MGFFFLSGFVVLCAVALFFVVDSLVLKPRLRRRMHKKRVDDSIERLVEAFAESPDELHAFSDAPAGAGNIKLGNFKSMAESYSEQHDLLNELHWRKQFIDGEVKPEE